MTERISYKDELNKEQLDVVQNADGPCLVLAGAGSGKTRTITYRVASLIEKGIQPRNILLVTFTNKAAREMLERVEGLLGKKPAALWGGTFHSIANRILRKDCELLGYQRNFTILDQEDSRSLIKVIVKDLKIDTTGRRFPSNKVLQNVFSYARNANEEIEAVVEDTNPSFYPLVDEIKEVYLEYVRRKKEANSMDFDDLLLNFLEILIRFPDVKNRYAEQFEYILVDEYQDTNSIQNRIVSELSSKHGNLLVVGDDAQSIYSFRGADIKNILEFPKRHRGTKIYKLEQNYRSTPEILDVANSVIEKNVEQYKKTLKAEKGSDVKPDVVAVPSDSSEAQFILKRILELNEQGTALSDIAVLFRATFHSQVLEFELMRSGILYDYRGGLKFFERAHVKDIVAHLRVINNLKDEVAWMRILGLHPGIGIVTASKIVDQVRHVDEFKSVPGTDLRSTLSAKAYKGWESFLAIAQKISKTTLNPAEVVRAIANSNYRGYLEMEYPNYQDRLEDIEQFALFAEEYPTIDELLNEISLRDETGFNQEQQDISDRVVLSTIHQAKGLEWPVVFVMHLTNGNFPNRMALDEDGGIEEERRLFYVASTRAKDKLFLTYPLTGGRDAYQYLERSMFLDDIPDNLIQQEIAAKKKLPQKSYLGSSWTEAANEVIELDEFGEEI